MKSIYECDALVESLTLENMAKGEFVFQLHRLAESEEGHVKKLLEFFDPPQGALVLDLACGVGAVAWFMRGERPDLNFILQNVSPSQLAMCPQDFVRVQSDYADMPVLPWKVDAVMMQYALGHATMDAFFGTCAKAMKPDGIVFLYDLMTTGDGGQLRQTLFYDTWTEAKLEEVAAAYGFSVVKKERPTRLHMAKIVASLSPEEFDYTFSGIYPMLYKFQRNVHA